jgi:hypothetical protein
MTGQTRDFNVCALIRSACVCRPISVAAPPLLREARGVSGDQPFHAFPPEVPASIETPLKPALRSSSCAASSSLAASCLCNNTIARTIDRPTLPAGATVGEDAEKETLIVDCRVNEFAPFDAGPQIMADQIRRISGGVSRLGGNRRDLAFEGTLVLPQASRRALGGQSDHPTLRQVPTSLSGWLASVFRTHTYDLSLLTVKGTRSIARGFKRAEFQQWSSKHLPDFSGQPLPSFMDADRGGPA